MALRNFKICSELTQFHKKCFAAKQQVASISYSKTQDERTKTIRLRILRQKDENFTPKSESNNETLENREFLQPAFLPKIPDFGNKYCCATTNQPISLYPEPIREHTSGLTNNFRVVRDLPGTYTTKRNYAAKKINKKSNPNKKEDVCPDKPRHCDKLARCPHFTLDCDQSKGSDCRHLYTDPKCKKRFAPYPSYSESCADRLPDDPSECTQCPWMKCGGVEAIKPQKKKFHTSTATTLVNGSKSTNTNGILIPMQAIIQAADCDKSDPCKRPPDPCEEREKRNKKKDHCEPKKKKYDPCKKMKCMAPTWTQANELWSLKQQRNDLCDLWVDLDMNATNGLLLKKKDKKKHNEKPKDDHASGHPPPCDSKKEIVDDPCIPKKRPRPYRKQRDLYGPDYKDEPYTTPRT